MKKPSVVGEPNVGGEPGEPGEPSVGAEGVVEQIEIYKTWDDMEQLDPLLLRGVFAYGFESPSDIQSKAIVPMLNGRDVVAQAQSGTGKTGAFVVGALGRIDLDVQATQVIIISPTKELAAQTAEVAKALGSLYLGAKTQTPLRVQLMYGGLEEQRATDGSGAGLAPHLICGCPGKICDKITRRGGGSRGGGGIDVSQIRLVILDEADELLKSQIPDKQGQYGYENQMSATFRENIYNIFQKLSTSVQVALFSATMPDYMTNLIAKIMQNPVLIRVEQEKLTLDGIKQYYLIVYNNYDKMTILRTIYNKANITQSIIYCNSVYNVIQLYNELRGESYPVCCIHSKMNLSEREQALKNFKSGKYRILISSDITARGIDVQQVSLVINYDIPTSPHTYLHRIGRGGRWGRKGVAINMVLWNSYDGTKVDTLEKHYQMRLEQLPDDWTM
jgi:translation initiation factor 4A